MIYIQTAVTIVALIFGANISGSGVSLSYDVFNSTLNVTPIVFLNVSNTIFNFGESYSAVTVGGTVLYYYSNRHPAFKEYVETTLLKYEIGHIKGYNHFGLNYFIKVFEEPCKYDPISAWGRVQCDTSRTLDVWQLPQNTGTFSIKF